MSHSLGEVWSLDGKLVGYYEYNGTVDIACSRIYKTKEECMDDKNWRLDNHRKCTCEGRSNKEVILFSYYGYGFYWAATICEKCQAITSNWDSEDSQNGHPFFDELLKLKYNEVIKCPKCKSRLEAKGDKAPISCTKCRYINFLWLSDLV